MNGFFQTLEQADKAATLAINSLHCPVTDFIWQCFSSRDLWIPLYAAVLVFLFVRLGPKKAIVVTLSCVLTIVVCDQLANFTKEYFARLRPCWDEYMLSEGLHLLEGKGNMYGFYSAHAANALGFAVCSALGFRQDRSRSYRPYTACICAWGVLVGLSRIFVGKHFLGDVLVGFAVGALAGWAMAGLASLVIRRLGQGSAARRRD